MINASSSGLVAPAVSESGGAYNSGQRGVTDGFVSSFWFNDLLGALARHGHAFGCRQAILGGHYALLDLRRRQPAPDFYSLLLWRRLMSPKSLRVVKLKRVLRAASGLAAAPLLNISSAEPDGAEEEESGGNHRAGITAPLLRAYAHCARSSPGHAAHAASGDDSPTLNAWGGVAVLLLNLAPSITHGVGLAGLARTDAPPPRLDFLLTPTRAGLRAPRVALNGVELRAAADGTLPPLPPRRAGAGSRRERDALCREAWLLAIGGRAAAPSSCLLSRSASLSFRTPARALASRRRARLRRGATGGHVLVTSRTRAVGAAAAGGARRGAVGRGGRGGRRSQGDAAAKRAAADDRG